MSNTYVETLSRKPAYIEDLEKGIFDSLFYERDTEEFLPDGSPNPNYGDYQKIQMVIKYLVAYLVAHNTKILSLINI